MASAAAEGIERSSLYFAELPTRQGVLARRALGRSAPGDDALTRRLLEQMRNETRLDGSVTGAVVPTIWRAHEFMDLGYRGDETSCARIMGWILQLQKKPGSFSQGCNPIRHANRVCEHFISGFFSPAPPEHRLAPVMFPNGKVFRAESAARFAVSCLALRAVLRARFDGSTIDQHVLSLIQLHELWTDWDGYFAGDAIIAGVHALAFVPEPHRAILSPLAALVAARQAADGSWPNADLFHTLEALVALGTAEARAAVRQAVPALLSRQRADGSFGSTAQQERGLIALRSLIWAEQDA
ncbi:MAG TPA: hypothetical protein VGC48_01975 [Gemmatimonadales bacterium]